MIDRTDDLLEWYGEDVYTEQAEPTTWEPVNLAGWINGRNKRLEPSVGVVRSDGQRVIYPGREHSVAGETESGKSWFALGCVAAELIADRRVLYIHYEEGDPGSTVERLLLIGVPAEVILDRLTFVAPTRPSRAGWLAELLDPAPALVVHDGVNEAMSLHGDDSDKTGGAATFRRNLIKPCLAAGAATLSCDHVTKASDGRGRYMIGAAHKLAAVDGAAFMLENRKPFGRGLRGVSNVFVTKDRPGFLRASGRPSGLPGKTFFGTLVVDNSDQCGPDLLQFYAPKDTDDDAQVVDRDPAAGLADKVFGVIAAQPDRMVYSSRRLFALMRESGLSVRDANVRDALEDLIVANRVAEVPGRANAKGYRASESASRDSSGSTASVSASASASPIGRDAGTRSHTTASGKNGTHWDAVGRTTDEEAGGAA